VNLGYSQIGELEVSQARQNMYVNMLTILDHGQRPQ
jgi:hypothetical protein